VEPQLASDETSSQMMKMKMKMRMKMRMEMREVASSFSSLRSSCLSLLYMLDPLGASNGSLLGGSLILR